MQDRQLSQSGITRHCSTQAHLGQKTREPCPAIEALYRGNQEYMKTMGLTNPGLLQDLANEGQRPPFMLVDCSDSRVNEQGIFSAKPGTIFTAGNVANQFDEADISSSAVLAYALSTLKVKHVVVLGHYGCGGVAASMLPFQSPLQPPPLPTVEAEKQGLQLQFSPADLAVQSWIHNIRDLYETSERSEIARHREEQPRMEELPHLHCPAFRALVEENVKANVKRISDSALIRHHYAHDQGAVYVHGWVYDVESGEVSDLGISAGPPGKEVPPTPFPLVGSSTFGK
ncbi:hypothetical protein K443DRAFT_677059 [Laccaria amethystina LaAM-08-1]|uniref:Carbonic anhydrase n=1 Tax=Laccaria amethystina LaAM-08-1 TaxID=1095629 RepID=A0A0C9Y4Q9_9AGAR|nr:hypothetical protein K443DRAFT_677059 [Laccaria amethystina LaAM-08-1]